MTMGNAQYNCMVMELRYDTLRGITIIAKHTIQQKAYHQINVTRTKKTVYNRKIKAE